MNYDVETALENALVALFKECTNIKVEREENLRDVHLSPKTQISDVIKIAVINETEEPGTQNLFAGMTMTVDIAAFASKKRDTASRKTNEARGLIRSVLAQTDIVDQINAIGDVVVYDQGVMVLGTFDISDDKNYIKGITAEIVARPK